METKKIEEQLKYIRKGLEDLSDSVALLVYKICGDEVGDDGEPEFVEEDKREVVEDIKPKLNLEKPRLTYYG